MLKILLPKYEVFRIIFNIEIFYYNIYANILIFQNRIACGHPALKDVVFMTLRAPELVKWRQRTLAAICESSTARCIKAEPGPADPNPS
jgi:hypothetical protein